MSDKALDDLLRSVGYHLRNLRYTRREKLAAVARTTGMAAGTLSEIENGKYKLSLEMLSKLAEYYKVPLEGLLTTDSPQRQEQEQRS